MPWKNPYNKCVCGNKKRKYSNRCKDCFHDEEWSLKVSKAKRKSKVISGEYIMLHLPEHPFANSRGHVYEHRVVMEKALSEIFDDVVYLEPEQVIHHIDGDTTNNTLYNLLLFKNNSRHKIFHAIQDAIKMEAKT